jgi:uncharacterized repeat protein (TIGR03803 family)
MSKITKKQSTPVVGEKPNGKSQFKSPGVICRPFTPLPRDGTFNEQLKNFSMKPKKTAICQNHAVEGGFFTTDNTDFTDENVFICAIRGPFIGYGSALRGLAIAVVLHLGVLAGFAQTFTTLHSFPNITDGAQPYAGLILSGNTLYGTTIYGGLEGVGGTVFALTTNGTGFTTLHGFGVTDSANDGLQPYDSLILSGNTLYGTTMYGGGGRGYGTVFALNTNGTGYTTLYGFTNGTDGAYPFASLILSGNTLYGATTGNGDFGFEGSIGPNGFGTVFAISANGTGFTILHGFTNGTDGANPVASLILSGNTLYGTACGGGANGNGTVFAINTSGMGFTTLYSFSAAPTNSSGLNTNSDGAGPNGLILSGNTLYGTVYGGGANGFGTVFAVNTNGTGFTTLYSFSAAPTNSSGLNTNSDGAYPNASLIISGNTLYGTTYSGGADGNGTVFAINTTGTGFTTLHGFSATRNGTNSDGAGPNGLILSGNTLYGTAIGGGAYGYLGTVFSLSLPSPLAIVTTGAALGFTNGVFGFDVTGPSGSNVVIQASTDLQTWIPLQTNLLGSGPLQFSDTNAPANAQRFYRAQLSQ